MKGKVGPRHHPQGCTSTKRQPFKIDESPGSKIGLQVLIEEAWVTAGTAKGATPPRVPLFNYPKIDLNPGLLLLGVMNNPGFKSTLGYSKSGTLTPPANDLCSSGR